MSAVQELEKLDPFDFEKLVANLWERRGFDTEVRRKTGDRGVDIEAEKVGYKEVIQVKRFSSENKVGSQIIREYATLYQQIPTANSVVIVTSSEFTEQASRLAEDLKVETVSGADLLELISEFDIDIESISSSRSTSSNSDELTEPEGLDYAKNSTLSGSERSQKAEELSNNARGTIGKHRLLSAGSCSRLFRGERPAAIDVFTTPNPELGIDSNSYHQPHYLLRNRKGLSDLSAAGYLSSMWVTDAGVHWFVPIEERSNNYSEQWRYLASHAVETIEYREGLLKDRIIIFSTSDKEYDFFTKKSDPSEAAVDYMIETYSDAELVS